MRSVVIVVAAIACVGAATPDSQGTMQELIKKDYELLTGTFRMVSGVIDGQEVPEEVRRKTILVTDHNKFTVSDSGAAGTSAVPRIPGAARWVPH